MKTGKKQDGTKYSTNIIHRGLSPSLSRVPAAPRELKLLGKEGDPLQTHSTQKQIRTRLDNKQDLTPVNNSTAEDWCYTGTTSSFM
jgi:hypothetical protein